MIEGSPYEVLKKASLWDQQGNIKIACDGIVIRKDKITGQTYILLIKRSSTGSAFPGCWALPGGGFDDTDESLVRCIEREVEEETGIVVTVDKLLFPMDKKDRDPRFRALTFVHLCHPVFPNTKPAGGDDADDAKWFTVREAVEMDLAFDHKDIIWKAIQHHGLTIWA